MALQDFPEALGVQVGAEAEVVSVHVDNGLATFHVVELATLSPIGSTVSLQVHFFVYNSKRLKSIKNYYYGFFSRTFDFIYIENS